MKIFSYLVCCASALVVAACGTSATASSSPSASPSASAAPVKAAGVAACALVTADEASSAAGKKVVNIVSLGAPSIPGACAYGVQRTTAAVFVYTQTYASASIANAVTTEQFQGAVASVIGTSSKDSKELSGIGDRAYLFTIKNKSGSGIAILVFKGKVVFLVALTPTTSSTTAENLAKTAASRIN